MYFEQQGLDDRLSQFQGKSLGKEITHSSFLGLEYFAGLEQQLTPFKNKTQSKTFTVGKKKV